MKLTLNNTKALDEIDGKWYILDLDDGSLSNRKYIFSGLYQYNAYCLSFKELVDIQRSNIFKSNIPLVLVCGIMLLVGQIFKKLPYVLIETSYVIKVLLLILSFFLVWFMIKARCIREQKKIERLLNKNIVWDTRVYVHFYSKKEKIKYTLFLAFTRLLFFMIVFILGVILFLVHHLLLGLFISSCGVFIMLVLNKPPKRFYYTIEKGIENKEDVIL